MFWAPVSHFRTGWGEAELSLLTLSHVCYQFPISVKLCAGLIREYIILFMAS